MTVLDASAVLALIQDEPGADLVASSLDGATMSTVNIAEVVGKIIDAGLDGREAFDLLVAAGVGVVPLTAEDALLAGALREVQGGHALSLGDRCCLALAVRSAPPDVLTADRLWAELDLPVQVRLIR
ncbi:type II toxin-antitoxin system VapC family toxin [uncultured Friedmanniella sp.]|uniref:type II toxin-antitoxin system VapC family toxin n=1 Tax=uncultured Friedmanniella sp. TaxID=335381 RepID=UPI0035CA5B69